MKVFNMIYGIDVGGTKIEIAIFEEDLSLISSWRIATPLNNYDQFINAIADVIFEADVKYECRGKVGLGMVGLIDQQGFSLSANISVANDKNVAKDLAEIIDRPVTCENDCRCFALSEANGGAGDGYESVYCAIIGTGAAGGYVVNGTLIQGRQNIAGEYGHLQLPATLREKYNLPLRKCGCGLPSCYEGYISGPGMEFIHQHLTGEKLSVIDIVNLWKVEPQKTISTLKCYLDILGSCFSNIILNYDPHVIVLGGGISLIDEILEGLERSTNQHLFKGFSAPSIIRAKFGDASGARGAAFLAKEEYNA